MRGRGQEGTRERPGGSVEWPGHVIDLLHCPTGVFLVVFQHVIFDKAKIPGTKENMKLAEGIK